METILILTLLLAISAIILFLFIKEGKTELTNVSFLKRTTIGFSFGFIVSFLLAFILVSPKIINSPNTGISHNILWSLSLAAVAGLFFALMRAFPIKLSGHYIASGLVFTIVVLIFLISMLVFRYIA